MEPHEHSIFQMLLSLGAVRRGQSDTVGSGWVAHLTVVEGLGADGQAAQFNALLELVGNLEALQLVVGVPGQLVGT